MSEVIQRLDEILTVFKEDVGDDVIDLAPDDVRSVGAESSPHVGVEAGFEVQLSRRVPLETRHFPHRSVIIAYDVLF